MDRALSPIAFAFPGAGIQPSGYEASLLALHAAAMRPCLERCGVRVGCDLAGAADGGFDALPPLPRQAFTYAYGVGMAEALRAAGESPAVVAGHSLGVYAAAVAAGATGIDEGLALLEAAWRAGTSACADLGVGMAALAGLAEDEVASLPGVDGEAVRVVLVNAPGSVVLAGPIEPIEAALAAATEAGAARTAWLDREVAYHHPRYMARAAQALRDAAAGMAFGDPEVPVASTIDGRLLRRAEDVRAFLAANLCTPIAWPRAIATFAAMGVEGVVECGPGLTLTRLARFLEPEMSWRNVRRLAKAAL